MVSVAGVTTPRRSFLYITGDQFKSHGRRGVQANNLVPKGSPAQQDAALTQRIEAAGGWCDAQIGPAVMAATLDTVQHWVNVDRRGMVTIFPRYRPVVGLTEFWIGPDVAGLRQIPDLSNVDVQESSFTVPVSTGALMTSSQGPIQFGRIAAPWDRALVRYTYVNGYPVTGLTAAAVAGALSIPVEDTTGIVAGKTWMTIYALENRFRFLATSVSTADAGGLGTGPGTVGCAAVPSNIPLSDPLYPPLVSALPPDLIEAVVLATRAMIKETGGGNVAATSSTSRSAKQARNPSGAGDDFALAESILRKHFVLGA